MILGIESKLKGYTHEMFKFYQAKKNKLDCLSQTLKQSRLRFSVLHTA